MKSKSFFNLRPFSDIQIYCKAIEFLSEICMQIYTPFSFYFYISTLLIPTSSKDKRPTKLSLSLETTNFKAILKVSAN